MGLQCVDVAMLFYWVEQGPAVKVKLVGQSRLAVSPRSTLPVKTWAVKYRSHDVPMCSRAPVPLLLWQGRCGDGDRVVLLTLKSTTKFYQRLGFKELPGSEVPG